MLIFTCTLLTVALYLLYTNEIGIDLIKVQLDMATKMQQLHLLLYKVLQNSQDFTEVLFVQL